MLIKQYSNILHSYNVITMNCSNFDDILNLLGYFYLFVKF